MRGTNFLNARELRCFGKAMAGFFVVALSFGSAGCASFRDASGAKSSSGQSAKAEESLDTVKVRFLEGLLTRDRVALSRLFTPDFSWREDESPMQETPFDFWDRHKLWEELQKLVPERVVKSGNLMVAPKAASRADFNGSRLAWRQVGGEWRLAHFYAGTQPGR